MSDAVDLDNDAPYVLARILYAAEECNITTEHSWLPEKLQMGGPYTSRVTMPNGTTYDISIART